MFYVSMRRLSRARSVFEKARKGRYAVGAFNAGSFETMKAIVGVAHRLRSPVILETSPGETSYFGVETLVAIVRSLEAHYQATVLLNLDHARDLTIVRSAIRAGFDIVHYDGSLLSPAHNARNLKKVVPLAHAHGILVEGEREHIAGNSTLHGQTLELDPSSFTDPIVARHFVADTGIDTLAVSVGEAHGLYKGKKQIQPKRIADIRAQTSAFLSLHGGSGIPAQLIRAAIQNGITKVNVNTELRQALAGGLRQALRDPQAIVPYEYFPKAIRSVERVVEAKIRIFGSAGKA